MGEHPALEAFQRAQQAQRSGALREALALAEAAHHMTVQIPGAPPQIGPVTSYYGFLLGTIGRRPERGLALCREALARDFWDPRVYAWLARLQVALDERREALETLDRGLSLAPEDRDLLEVRQMLGIRRPPVLPFLHRGHFLNRWLGRRRARRIAVLQFART